ncbi:Spy/CpxP family protein refolding chaperone [Novacetimonas cocois]|uniref:LTXXQ motif family protein n=1 Tax=Novacetimonas cocois TaxID=1747507 RepID=A0A365YVL5_9PROT|nr:Spy/CpxP family protein refolding chaperone [Novacetimonas cocois]RBM06325.1 hypothetical protein NJLHNGOC_10025 [Novacetimonas cocois]
MILRRILPVAALLLPGVAMAAVPPTQPAPAAATAPLAHTPHDPTPEQLEEHISTLHQQLHITKAQEKLWAPFAQDMRDNASRLHDAIENRRSSLPTLSATDNMQSYAALVAERAQDMQTLNQAFVPLYASFSKKQKKNADALFRMGDEQHGEHQATAQDGQAASDASTAAK